MVTARFPVELTWSGASGSPGANVFHGRNVDPLEATEDLNGLAVILRTFYEGLTAIYPDDVNIHFAGIAFGVGDDTGSQWDLTPWTVEGTGGTDHLSPLLQALVQWRTNSGGRSGRGRTFIGPLTDDCSEDNGTPDEAVRTLLLTQAADLIESSDTFNNGALGVYSRTQNIFRDFTGSACPNYFAYLSGRRD